MSTQEAHGAVVDMSVPGPIRPALSSVICADESVPGDADRASGVIIVGIDGSRCARNAAQWAATEAVRMNAALGVVFAYHLPPAGSSGYTAYPANLLTDLRQNGREVLADTTAVLRRANPRLRVTTELVYGHPAAVLQKAAKRALLTVVGSHGANRVANALGSVAAEVAESCPGPVAVIHDAASPSTGPVVVGVDGSTTSRAAIEYAFAAADARKVSLIAVHCWTDPSIDGPLPAYSAGPVTVQQIEEENRALLDHELADWLKTFPDVRVQQAVIHDHPAAGLIDYAPFAQLIVVGSRGHGGIAGMLLGSTGQALIAHGSCPVVIVRPGPAHPRR